MLSGLAIATIAWGLLVGEARQPCKCDEPEPPTRLLTHGGALALVAVAVIAALTWASWRAQLRGALATTGLSLVAWIVLGIGWLVVGTQAPDTAAYQAMLATWLLGALLVARVVLDVVLAWLQRRVDARPPPPAPLPVGTVHRS